MLSEPRKTQFDMNFNLLRIPVRIHPGFWIVAILFGLGDITKRPDWTLPVFVGCLFVSILVHEFGHALSARRFGARSLRIVLHAIGGLAISDGGLPRKQRIMELLWGPGAGFILGALVLAPFLGHYYEKFDLGVKLAYTAWTLLFINIVWGLLNLLPIYPLDGGQIAMEVFTARKTHGGVALTFQVSMYTAIVCAVLGLGYAFYSMYRQEKPEWIVVIFFALMAYQNYQFSQSDYLHAAEEQRRQVKRQPWEQDPDWWKK